MAKLSFSLFMYNQTHLQTYQNMSIPVADLVVLNVKQIKYDPSLFVRAPGIPA